MKASNFRSEKPMGGPFDLPPPLDVQGLNNMYSQHLYLIIITLIRLVGNGAEGKKDKQKGEGERGGEEGGGKKNERWMEKEKEEEEPKRKEKEMKKEKN